MTRRLKNTQQEWAWLSIIYISKEKECIDKKKNSTIMEMMAVTIQQNGGIIICNSIFDEIISASLIWIFELFFTQHKRTQWLSI